MAPRRISPEPIQSSEGAQCGLGTLRGDQVPVVGAEVRWYNRRARICKFEHYVLKSLQMAIATAIPILAMQESPTVSLGLLGSIKVTMLSGILGAFVVFLEGLYSSLAPHQRWVKYRDAYMALTTEVMLHTGRVGEYARQDPDCLLVERAVRVIRSEHQSWDSIEQRTEVQGHIAAASPTPISGRPSLAPTVA